MPSISISVDPNSDLHRRLIKEIRERHMASAKKMEDLHNRWRLEEEKTIAYLPEKETDAKRRVAREQGGNPQYTTMVLPYSYAMLMTAHTYWTTVFLGRRPVHQYNGRHGEGEQQTQALEALINYQVQVGEMLVPYYIWLLDPGKYGIGILGSYWAEENAIVSEVSEREQMLLGVIPTGRIRKVRNTRVIPGYHGNKVYNVRPYNWFPDPRLPMHRFQEGEYCGVYSELGWNEILRRQALGIYINTEKLKGSTRRDINFDQGSQQLEVPDIAETEFDDQIGTGPRRKRSGANFHGLYEYTIELVPSDWGIGKVKLPEKWNFTTNSDLTLIVSARPQDAIHNRFPFDILQYEPEGYGFSSRSLTEIIDPVQRTMDWLINSHFYNVRKALNLQVAVDPSRVVMKDLLDPRPGNVVRLKPKGYGTKPGDAIEQLPFFDVTKSHINDMEMLHQYGQRILGINDQIMGIPQQGGRRTAAETRSSNSFSINRLKTNSEYYSAMGFEPHSQMLVMNSQQYYDGEKKFRIVGDFVQEAGRNFIDVTPESIAGFYDFEPVDGAMPIDRFAQANLWTQILAQLKNNPQLAAGYDISRIFAWVAQLAGLKNINKFKVQVVPDEIAQQQATAGNIIPMPNSPEIVPEPGQIPGMGTTG